jgi:predicted DCC family thiol-disulfide oxidoreductase YuxK
VILFDGVCNICSSTVAFIIPRDPGAQFRFASLQSETARRLLRERNAGAPALESMVLVEDNRVFTRSTAALRIARRLAFPWSLASLLLAVPRPFRDWAYDFVARNRYRWFGKRETCMIPSADVRSRFLE